MVDADPIIRLNVALEGRYRIERQLGEGGMATVYLAEDLKHHRRVALKVLKPELAAVVGADRFLAEIETTANLTHPHILPLHDSGEADSFLYYVMPYVEGESLRERFEREHQLPVEEAVGIATNVAEALDYAHRQGVIHRDIKPANILLQDGKPVISDFGIALAVGVAGAGRLTETGLSMGTPHYMSPEQATGDLSVGPATDIYALGCVLYEMLTGEPPYTGATAQAVLGRIVTEEPRPVTEERKSVPAHVEGVISRALEKVPADRFGSAGEMARALGDEGFRWGAAVSSPREMSSSGPWKIATAVAVAATVVLTTLVLVSANGRDAGSVIQTSIVTPVDETLVRSWHSYAMTSDGSRIIYRVVKEGGGTELRSRLLSEPRAVSLSGTEGAGLLFLSPDGRWVAFYHPESRELRRVPVEGGAVEVVARLSAEEGALYGGTWGPDGSVVVATRPGLRSVPASGGVFSALTETGSEEERHRQPVFLPGGDGLVFTVTEGQFPEVNELTLLDTDGTLAPLVEGHSAQVTHDGLLIWARGETGELWGARLDSDRPQLLDEPMLVSRGVSTTIGLTSMRSSYTVSDAGALLYAPADVGTGWSLVWVDRDGGSQQTILDASDPQLPPGGVGMHGARLSPDGSRIAFTLVYEEAPGFRIFVHDLSRGTTTPILVDANADWAAWTADAERLAFNRFGEDSFDLFWTRADNNSTPEALIPPNPPTQFPQNFTSDGTLLVVAEDPGPTGGRDLMLVSLAGGETRPLVATPAPEYQADLSPDERWLAYTSEELGAAHVYLTDFPEAETRLRLSVESGYGPVWSPRGDELFYRRTSDDALVSVEVSVDSSGGIVLGQPEVLFGGPYRACCSPGRTFDVALDGDRFLMLWRAEQGGGVLRLELVQNFVPDVLRRLDDR